MPLAIAVSSADDVEGETQLERIQRAHNHYHSPPHHVYELTAEEIQKRQAVLERGTPAERYELLSEMERKVLPLFNLPSNDICSLLNIDSSRLKVFLHGIFVKLDLSSRREAFDVWRHLSGGPRTIDETKGR
jgi:ATP/maltotriose-dependent transcriptional regulator MalT